MKHKATFYSSPRLLLFSTAAVALPVGGILLMVSRSLIPGLVVLAVGLALGFLLYYTLTRRNETWIEAGVASLVYKMPDGKTIDMLWKRVVLAGLIIRPLRLPVLFLYEGRRGLLLQIPPIYSGFPGLVKTVRSRTRFQRLSMKRGEKLEDRIRRILG